MNPKIENEPGDSIRLEFETRAKHIHDNPNWIDKILHPFYPITLPIGKNKNYEVPYIRKLPYLWLSVSVMLTLGCISLSSVVLITAYRLFMSTLLSGLDSHHLISDNAILIGTDNRLK